MYEFEIPEDTTECSEEDLQECLTEAKREFDLLNDSEDISNETLERMTDLADCIESLFSEMENRVELAVAKRSTFAQQIKAARFGPVMASFRGTEG